MVMVRDVIYKVLNKEGAVWLFFIFYCLVHMVGRRA